MRKLAILAALAASALAAPAFATDHSAYVGLEGGALFPKDLIFDVGPSPLAPGGARTRVDGKTGYDIDAVLGYDFGMFRLEEEISYKRDRVTEITTGPLRTPAAVGGAGAPPGIYNDASGKNSSFGVMANALFDYDWGTDSRFSSYIGGGAGIATVKLKHYNVSGADFLNSTVTKRFAWQAIAGARYALTDHIDVGAKYRYYTVTKLNAVDRLGASYHGKWKSHSAMLSIIYNLASRTPPPPPAPPPPPPPPAVEAPGPFIVFFDWDKSNITPEAASILDNAANAYTTTGQAKVVLAGHADKSGSDQYNIGLSQRRADSVKAYLAGKGVPDGAMSTEAFGESKPLVDTADGVREPQNRRVEITFGAGM